MARIADQVNSLRIRSYTAQDREAVRCIALATAMMGQPASIFFEGGDVFADALTAYFTDREPESSFVAESNEKCVGYIIGARDTRMMDSRFQKEMLMPFIQKILMSGVLFRSKNLLLLSQVILPALSGRLIVPDFYGQYPATLHINLLPEARGLGVGVQLMGAFLKYLRGQNVPGVRMATMSESAGRFFAGQGFSLLHRSTRPYFKHITGKDVPLLIYGKRLL